MTIGFDLVCLCLAVFPIVEVLRHGEVFARYRARIEAQDGWLAYLVSCPSCLSVWVAGFLFVILAVSLFLPDAWSTLVKLPIYLWTVIMPVHLYYKLYPEFTMSDEQHKEKLTLPNRVMGMTKNRMQEIIDLFPELESAVVTFTWAEEMGDQMPPGVICCRDPRNPYIFGRAARQAVTMLTILLRGIDQRLTALTKSTESKNEPANKTTT